MWTRARSARNPAAPVLTASCALALLLFASVAMAGSTAGRLTTGSPSSNGAAAPLRVPGMGRPPLSISRTIDGSVGGAVVAGRWTVVVPPGAFNGTGTISVTVPDASVLSCTLDISPASLNGFARPVGLVCDANGVETADFWSLVVGYYDPALGKWTQVTNSRQQPGSLTVEAPLWHFSSYGVVSGKAGW